MPNAPMASKWEPLSPLSSLHRQLSACPHSAYDPPVAFNETVGAVGHQGWCPSLLLTAMGTWQDIAPV